MTARPWPRLLPRAELALALAMGMAMALGQVPWGAWWLALPAFAGLARLVATAPTPRRAALLAWTAGAGHFALALSWIVEPFLIDAAATGWMAPFALVLMAAGLALFWAAAGAAAGFGRPRALAFAVALAAAEALRGVVLTGFPWAQPGHIWIETPVAQMAAWVGPDGLTLFTLLAAALPVALGIRGGVAAAALLAAAFGLGTLRLGVPLAAEATAPIVRLVQPNADQRQKWEPARARALFDRLLEMTRATGPAPVALTIWPETSVPYLMDTSPGALWEIGEAGGGAPVIAGIQRSDGGGLRYWNSLAIAGVEGEVLGVYDKHHLVPFGEYIPFGDLAHAWFGLKAFATQEGYGYSAGPGPRLLEVPGIGAILPLICYEAVFPAIPLRAPGRARVMVQITNDAWFGTQTGPFQHLALARLRAIEQGLPLLRSANTGVTAVIDARGRLLEALALGTTGVIDAPLPASLPPTFFARIGRGPVWLLLVSLALALAARRRLDGRGAKG